MKCGHGLPRSTLISSRNGPVLPRRVFQRRDIQDRPTGPEFDGNITSVNRNAGAWCLPAGVSKSTGVQQDEHEQSGDVKKPPSAPEKPKPSSFDPDRLQSGADQVQGQSVQVCISLPTCPTSVMATAYVHPHLTFPMRVHRTLVCLDNQ